MVACARSVTIGILFLALAAIALAGATTDHLHLSAKAHNCALCQPAHDAQAPVRSLILTVPHETADELPPPALIPLPMAPVLDSTQPRAPPAA